MKLITNNFSLKLFSLALAGALCAYVYLYLNYPITQALAIPLRVQGLADELVVANAIPQEVQLKLRGPYRSIQQISRSHLFAYIDCRPISGATSTSLRVQLPDFGDVAVTAQDYEFVDIELDTKMEKTLPILIQRLGEVDANFQISKEVLSGYSVHLLGPAKDVGTVVKATVQPEVAGLAQDASLLLAVRPLDNQGQLVKSVGLVLNPREVEYSVSLLPAGSIRILKVIPEFTGQPAPDCVLGEPTPQPLFIPVDAELVPGDQRYVLTEPINLAGARSSFNASVRLIYPFEAPESAKLPETCMVFVEIYAIEQQQQLMVSVEVQLSGRQTGRDYIVTPPKLILRSDELANIQQAERAAIRATLNVAGLAPGEYRLAPQVALPAQLARVTIIPSTLQVTVIQTED